MKFYSCFFFFVDDTSRPRFSMRWSMAQSKRLQNSSATNLIFHNAIYLNSSVIGRQCQALCDSLCLLLSGRWSLYFLRGKKKRKEKQNKTPVFCLVYDKASEPRRAAERGSLGSELALVLRSCWA